MDIKLLFREHWVQDLAVCQTQWAILKCGMPHDSSIFVVLVNHLCWIFLQTSLASRHSQHLFCFCPCFLTVPYMYITTLVVFQPFLPLNPLLQSKILKTCPKSCNPTTDCLSLLSYLNRAAWERGTPLQIAIGIISHSTTHTPVQMNFTLMMRKPKLIFKRQSVSYWKWQHLYANLWDSVCSFAFWDMFSLSGPGQPSTWDLLFYPQPCVLGLQVQSITLGWVFI